MRYLPALILDAVLVLVFAAIGRASHAEDPGGFLLTAWPFLVALLIGHAVAAVLPARPRRPWSISWGAVVWAITVVGGMLLRVASGQTAQAAFIVVATLTLGVFLLGWRATTAFLRRRRAATSDDAAAYVGHADDRAQDGGATPESEESWDVPAADREPDLRSEAPLQPESRLQPNPGGRPDPDLQADPDLQTEPASVRDSEPPATAESEPPATAEPEPEPQSTTESTHEVESYRLRPANPNRS